MNRTVCLLMKCSEGNAVQQLDVKILKGFTDMWPITTIVHHNFYSSQASITLYHEIFTKQSKSVFK